MAAERVTQPFDPKVNKIGIGAIKVFVIDWFWLTLIDWLKSTYSEDEEEFDEHRPEWQDTSHQSAEIHTKRHRCIVLFHLQPPLQYQWPHITFVTLPVRLTQRTDWGTTSALAPVVGSGWSSLDAHTAENDQDNNRDKKDKYTVTILYQKYYQPRNHQVNILRYWYKINPYLLPEAEEVAQQDKGQWDAHPHAQQRQHRGEGNLKSHNNNSLIELAKRGMKRR